MKPLHTATLALTATLVACGPLGLDCTQMGCIGSLIMNLPTASLADAEYILTLEHDGTTEQCTFALPFDAASAVCTQGSELELNGDIISLNHPLEMGMQFDTVFVELSEQDFTLVSETLDIEWAEPFYPNGKACDDGFGCYSAEVEISLD